MFRSGNNYQANMYKILNSGRQLWAQYVCIGVWISITACTQAYTANAPASINPVNIKPPVIIPAGQPVIVKIDTCRPLLPVDVPEKDSSWANIRIMNEVRKIRTGPPLSKPADFFIPMQNYNMEKGLAIDAVISGFRDKAGNLWFGTEGGGVTRYNGKTSVTFTADEGLVNNAVACITEDKEGNIWFTAGGISKYDGRSITSFTKSQGLISNEVISIAIDSNGDLLLATREGPCRFDGKHFFNLKTVEGFAGKEVRTITQDKKGNAWFGTRESGVNRYNGKTFTNYSTRQGLKDNEIVSSYADSKGNLWFGTRSYGVSRYDGISFTNFKDLPGLPRHTIHSIAEDREGNIWFGAFKEGVSRYDGNIFVNMTIKQGLPHNTVYSITEDKSGNLWFGTYGGGVSCYGGKAFTVFTTEQGLADNTVRNIIEDRRGNFWFGMNSGGACRYDGQNFSSYYRAQGLFNDRVNRILEDKAGNLWFCTGAGACRFDGKTITNFTTWQGLVYDVVRSIVEDRNGNIWFGTEMGLSKYDGKYFYNFTRKQGLASNNIRDMLEDEEGNLWLGTHEGGLVLYDGKNFLTLDTAQGLVNNFIFNLTKDSKGNIWVCTGDGGISILRKEAREKLKNISSIKSGDKLFENFSAKEGLADNVVYDAVEDKQGNMIIGTNLGFTIVKGGLDPAKPIARDQLEYYSWKNGYPVKDVNTQAMYVDSKGIIWAGTGGKLVRFDYSAIHKNTDPPEVRIQSLKINNETVSWYNLLSQRSNEGERKKMLGAMKVEEKTLFNRLLSQEERDSMQKKFTGMGFDSITPFYPLPLHLSLPYRNNNVSFDFAAIEPARPGMVRYQYMLEEYDKDWSPVSDKSFASFGNINEGKYTFKVKAMSPDGVWSNPVYYSFTVLPPWHRTLWAYIAYALAIILSLYVIYRNRIERLEKKQALQLQTVIATQEEERKRISRDLHDDVGTKLSALKLFLSSLKVNVDKKEYGKAEVLASNSDQLINETIKDVREMLLNLSPGILEEFGFTTAIEGLVAKINQAGTIYFELSVFGFNGILKKEYELSLYRITQELINNVLKHSGAKNVSLQIGYRDEKFIIMVEDDGRGFNLDKHKNGYGLKNLDARTKLLNGTMNIDSKLGKGTCVSIEVPYKFT
jgi:signal transduction histidine kinase/ligand-binding sensor domain-containing protein